MSPPKKLKEAYYTDDPARIHRQTRNLIVAILIPVCLALSPYFISFLNKTNEDHTKIQLQQQDINNMKEDFKTVLDALSKQAEINANSKVEVKQLQNDVYYYKNELGEIKRIVLKYRGKTISKTSNGNLTSYN